MGHLSKFITLVIIVFFAACNEQADLPVRGDLSCARVDGGVYFNQALLKDILLFLSQRSGRKIIMSSKLAEIDDLWVDYQTNSSSLEVILDGICQFIRKQHRVDVVWTVQHESVLLRLRNEN